MLYSLATGYAAVRGYQQLIDTVAHNLANIKTPSFKEKCLSFHELPGSTLLQRRLPRPANQHLEPAGGTGTAPAFARTVFTGGTMEFTGDPFHLAISGEGFFELIRPDGSRAYTRCGAFYLDAAGHVVTPRGDRLSGLGNLREAGLDSGKGSISMGPDGKVYLSSPGMSEDPSQEELGTIFLYRFVNPQRLSQVDNVFIPTAESGPPVRGVPGTENFGAIKQGYLESANVELSRQITTLILGQRSLQAAARSMVVADELWSLTLNVQA